MYCIVTKSQQSQHPPPVPPLDLADYGPYRHPSNQSSAVALITDRNLGNTTYAGSEIYPAEPVYHLQQVSEMQLYCWYRI